MSVSVKEKGTITAVLKGGQEDRWDEEEEERRKKDE